MVLSGSVTLGSVILRLKASLSVTSTTSLPARQRPTVERTGSRSTDSGPFANTGCENDDRIADRTQVDSHPPFSRALIPTASAPGRRSRVPAVSAAPDDGGV